jgi:chemotaxis protein CheD
VLAERTLATELLYVEPGQLLVSTEPHRLRTVLGSCVSVCLYDQNLRMGGMNHFMLPKAPQGEANSFRYGDVAMHGLLERLERLGSKRQALFAHVCGGARVLSSLSSAAFHLGQANAEFAFEWLEMRHISLMSSDVLGTTARRLDFDLVHGECWSRPLGVD